MAKLIETFEGGCSCGKVRYKMASKPLIVHCCHCSWCQRQTGSAFAVNALIEADRVELLQGEVAGLVLDTPSGAGQRISRCPSCKTAVWSEYLIGARGIDDVTYFIRVGTLDQPEKMPPDVHIYTSTKQPWVILSPETLAVKEFYDWDATLSPESLARDKANHARAAARLAEKPTDA